MHDLIRKPMTVALAAVLLFCSVVPVPTGAAMFDRARANQAYANPIAGTAAEMALLAFQTACVAGGIYIAGTTLSELNINSQEIYNAFTNYYTDQNNISQSELEAILAGSYTNGNVDLSALAAAGITGAIPGFAAYLLNDGDAVVNDNSAVPNAYYVNMNGTNVGVVSDASLIPGYSDIDLDGLGLSNRKLVAYTHMSVNDSYHYYFAMESVQSINFYYDRYNGIQSYVGTSYSDGSYVHVYKIGADGQLSKQNNIAITLNRESVIIDNFDAYYASVQLTQSNANDGVIAGISSGVVEGTYTAIDGVVQAFNPTAEQLQAGYDASILQGVEQAVADLGTISTGIAALDATMNGLLGVCQGIASTLSNTVVGQYCAAVTQWLGATPFGTVMGTVIDGLDAIPDSVAEGAAVVAGGVAALPGALEGVIEGVLEGVFGQPLAIPGFLQDILAGVQAIPGALEGAIEGITFPEWRWPEAPEIPRVNGEPVPFALSADLIADMQTDLRDKVPFCYLIRIGESLGTLFGNLQTSRSFYFDMDVPVAGSVHFDGEGFLNQPLLGSNIADVIRICATALLCTGLLYGAYKVAREL